MDCQKIGSVILRLRKENGMTQREVADALGISDKTVSKWERGLGCPDVSLLPRLSEVLRINIEEMLLGELNSNDYVGGNMKKIKFYLCPSCGNVLTSTGEGAISCCGRKLEPLVAKAVDEQHQTEVELVEDDYFVTIDHSMTKEHYISFVAYTKMDRMLLIKLYPEQNAEIRLPKMKVGKLYFCCIKDGLFEQKL